jgi:hypothetical protein
MDTYHDMKLDVNVSFLMVIVIINLDRKLDAVRLPDQFQTIFSGQLQPDIKE